MDYIQLPRQACFKPLYSPRTTFSRHRQQINQLATNLAINIDKYILGFLKTDFEDNSDKITMINFILSAKTHLKTWQKDLPFRQQKMIQCLRLIFLETDTQSKGYITWSQFNSMLIQKGLNLKTLRSQQPGSNLLLKQMKVNYMRRHNNPIQKMVSLGDRIALFSQQSSHVQFLGSDGQPASLKPIVLSQQQLVVETGIIKRGKYGHKQIHKKDMVVAQYRNIVLDMIYIKDNKYNMLVTSSSDLKIKGWDVSSTIPTVVKQPQNQDEKMEHEFSVEIYTMAWDNVNQVLYACGKGPKIYQWQVKTDSDRQLWDPDGHTDMISSMIMMNKLQFLATGGYDGKLVLWDTISQTKKFVYKQHTRSISSMAFHQDLILLFTSAYDHTICVWNPYIQSLVHKIMTNINCIQLDIIPETNLLIALDHQSNIKIRQINKFTLISSYTIDKLQSGIQPTCMIALNQPLRYYFGGNGITGYEYIYNDSNPLHDSPILSLYIHPSTLKLYAPIKNHMLAWDLLTGSLVATFRNIVNQQITAVQLLSDVAMTVIGDSQGNLSIRKLQNGVIVKNLYKHKQSVNKILCKVLSKTILIVSASLDGEVVLFDRDAEGDFTQRHSLSVRKYNPLATVSALSYQQRRGILSIGSISGDLYFIDTDKGKKISEFKCSAQILSLILVEEEQILLCCTRKGQIEGIYLPQHPKKFKKSCHIIISPPPTKINCLALSNSNRCYAGCDNGDIICFRWFAQGQQKVGIMWKTLGTDSIRSLVLLQQQNCLICLGGPSSVFIVTCDTGSKIAKIQDKLPLQPKTLIYLDEDTHSLYYKPLDHLFKITINNKQEQVRQIFDPHFYTNIALSCHPDMEQQSNSQWKFHPNLVKLVETQIKNNLELTNLIHEESLKPKKIGIVKTQTLPGLQRQKALQILKQSQIYKEEQQNMKNTNAKPQSLHNSYSMLNMRSSKIVKTLKQQSQYPNPGKTQGSALYRLGLALLKVDEHDQKAYGLVNMAQKQSQKSSLKLPKIKKSFD